MILVRADGRDCIAARHRRRVGIGAHGRDRRSRATCLSLAEFSFPSGHTLHAVPFTLMALGHCPMLAWLLIPFTVGVGASRVVLGLHYPSDVLAATGIGVAIASVSLWLVLGATLFGAISNQCPLDRSAP